MADNERGVVIECGVLFLGIFGNVNRGGCFFLFFFDSPHFGFAQCPGN